MNFCFLSIYLKDNIYITSIIPLSFYIRLGMLPLCPLFKSVGFTALSCPSSVSSTDLSPYSCNFLSTFLSLCQGFDLYHWSSTLCVCVFTVWRVSFFRSIQDENELPHCQHCDCREILAKVLLHNLLSPNNTWVNCHILFIIWQHSKERQTNSWI